MFDIGFTELLIIGIVALIVVGPKDLPQLFRTLGRFTARARALGREFTSAMNAAADESGMKDVAKDLKGVTNPRSYGLDKLKEAADSFEKWDPAAATGAKPPERGRVDPDRAADMAKIREATEKAGQAKLDREAAEKAAAEAAEAPAKATAAKKPAAKKAAAKKTAAKKPTTKKPTTKKPAAKKPAAAKTAVKEPAAKKPAKTAPAAKAKTAPTDKADDA